MNDGQSTRAQIVERIKGSSNILVTVSVDPSVDELSAALGLTIMLNSMNKHATAVVSGEIPPAITFLEPDKTFENTVDSLRDFIIALDKEKADHLRYKVDGDVVKIFITPYRTTITADDLDFSQGDYNVELVLALGVQNKEHLDKALQAHGRILHDATVATLSCGEATSELGSIDWNDPNASSLSEMLVALSEALKGDKPLLDEQSATAFLTGIVAATDRFSNNRTSSKVMTMAAQLMAAGANQQLIAAKLEEGHEIGPDQPGGDGSESNGDGTTDLAEGESTKVAKTPAKKKAAKPADGELEISHEQPAEAAAEPAAVTAEDALAKQLANVAPAAAKPSVADLKKDLASASAELDDAAKTAEPAEAALPPVVTQPDAANEPTLGGTLNATTEQAHEDNEAELASDRNKTILSHNGGTYSQDTPAFQAPFNAAAAPPVEPPSVDIFNGGEAPAAAASGPATVPGSAAVSSLPASEPSSAAPAETLADLDKKVRSQEHEDAHAAVQLAYEATPFTPANHPQANVGAQALGEVDHGSPAAAAPPPVPVMAPPATPPPALDFSKLPPPPPPPLPSFDTPLTTPPQGALEPEQLGQIFDTAPSVAPQPPAANDPNQFKIPGQ
jgi:hypothetical protein